MVNIRGEGREGFVSIKIIVRNKQGLNQVTAMLGVIGINYYIIESADRLFL